MEQAADLEICQEGAFLEEALDLEVGGCLGSLHAFAGAGGSSVGLSVDGLQGDGLLSVESFDGEILAIELVEDGGEVVVDLPWSGEYLVRLDTEVTQDVTLTRTCVAGCDLRYTRYPLFLMHGMAGTDTYVGLVDYFDDVVPTLRGSGYEVAVGAVDPFQVTPGRAVQWAAHLDDFFADGRHRKVNLIGHSQGGMDARYVSAHLDPEERVASVLTIGTPHHGTAVAALGAGLIEHSAITEGMVEAAIGGVAEIYGVDSSEEIVAQIQGLAPDAMAAFNDAVPDRDDVYYASWGGKSCQWLDIPCLWTNDGETITAPLAATHLVLQILEGDNDGLVSVASARWGVDYGALSADHMDQVGLLNVFDFDHLTFYEQEADYLFALGF